MTSSEIDNQIGSWEDRQAWTAKTADLVKHFLTSVGLSVQMHYRAKTNESVLEKMARFGESLSEVHDLYGLRIIAPTFEDVERVANAVIEGFGATPTTREMTIRGGTLVFAQVRNYRKRDWVGVSPATSGGYNDAIHLNRKYDGRMIEVQIVTQALFEKYCDPTTDESHDAFKKRQAAIHHS